MSSNLSGENNENTCLPATASLVTPSATFLARPPADNPLHQKRGTKKKNSSPAQKRGNKGNFSPGRLAWLRERLPAYNTYADSKQKKKIGSGRSFWCGMFPDYHVEFPWRLPLKEDMPEDPEEAAALSQEPENDEEIAKKTQVVEDVETISFDFFLEAKG